ncbi:uncharacterized protein LOC127262304 [Andrographis paniculata]|uniref:uncharacterized protein LOC127262304 n=1 Tax=Andrographis paniculata TaxID=175694 RepID=UPI0021E8B163|nr:uncharacterized protein LOC127262304 [Andrographis paniculata]
MADVKTVDEGHQLPEKRKLDLPIITTATPEEGKEGADLKKKQKVEIPTEENGAGPHVSHENPPEPEELQIVNADVEEEDDEDYNVEQDEDGHEDPEILDRAAKVITAYDKGKGKMVAGFECDDSDDSDDDTDGDSTDSSDNGQSDEDEGEMEDDLLAEIDLGNILPSRTRRHQVHRGIRIGGGSNVGNNA